MRGLLRGIASGELHGRLVSSPVANNRLLRRARLQCRRIGGCLGRHGRIQAIRRCRLVMTTGFFRRRLTGPCRILSLAGRGGRALRLGRGRLSVCLVGAGVCRGRRPGGTQQTDSKDCGQSHIQTGWTHSQDSLDFTLLPATRELQGHRIICRSRSRISRNLKNRTAYALLAAATGAGPVSWRGSSLGLASGMRKRKVVPRPSADSKSTDP